VLERSSHMFDNPFMSDIKFTCEDSAKSFYAHKYVLGTSSAVFHAMFYGDLAETKPVVHFSDTDEESLEQFLCFLYTDKCDLTADNVVSVMYLSKKYIVSSLTEKCVEFMEKGLNVENVLRILELAIHFDEGELGMKCWQLVESRTADVATTEAFNNISQKTLACVLKRDHLNIPEVQLFQAVLKWCDEQCSKKQLKVSGENRRAVLKDAIYDIAYLSMSQEDFAKHVHLSGLLSTDEMVSVYGRLSGIELPCVKWKKRKQKGFERIARFLPSNVNDPASWWQYFGNPDCLSFSVNRKSLFHGVRLFGDRKGSQYKVVLQLDGSELANGSFTSKIDKDGVAGFDVRLSSPVTVEKNSTVTISATISGSKSCYGENGMAEVENGEFNVSFYDASAESTNGTGPLTGQFYEIFISHEES
jgi:BTB/POZ domain-containing protein 3/6